MTYRINTKEIAENKKIKNATPLSYDGIDFKSKLEKQIYVTLNLYKLSPQYESKTFVIWEGYTSHIPFYDRESQHQKTKRVKKGDLNRIRSLTLKPIKLRDITYTPDFYIRYNNLDVYIESKGFENDVFPIKKKLFRRYLDDLYTETGQKSIYFEVYTITQLLQALEIIKNLE